ncbi:MAG: hypothetical protein ACYS9T_00055 [Planctomycetota bacterium]|jgi:hypothetical protein
MAKSLVIKLWVVFCLLGLSVGFFVISQSCAAVDNNSSSSENNDANKADSVPSQEKPIVIWSHNSWYGSIPALETVLSSGLITHVLVGYMHRNDYRPKDGPNIRKSIEIVKKSGAKLIWCRPLWEYYAVENSKFEDLFDSSRYIREIRNLRGEGREIGADFIAFDTESSGSSPMRRIFISNNRVILNDRDHRRLELVIEQVIKTTGKIDFILPAGYWGYPGHNHPYDVLAKLGKLRIAENTYYDNMRAINAIKYPYEIFGVHLDILKENKRNKYNTYFLPYEIFERSDLWSDKKGIFLYTNTKKSLAVAGELLAYSRSLPVMDRTKSSDSNSP